MARGRQNAEELNPYRPPVADDWDSPAGNGPRRHALFRWRVIPCTLCALNGASELFLGIAAPFAAILTLLFAKPLPDSWYLPFLIAFPLALVAGGAWLRASQAWLEGRWRKALVWTLLLYALHVIPGLAARSLLR